MSRRCPICGRPVEDDPRPPSFPFCSHKCKMVDLGNWLDGRYRIPAEEDEVFSENIDVVPDESLGGDKLLH